MPIRANYPATVAEVLVDGMRFKAATVEAVKRFARWKPWRGRLEVRQEKVRALHAALCSVYGKVTRLEFRNSADGAPGSSGHSSYSPQGDVIVLRGRLSVVTYLHEFGHALGKDERQTCRWSINLFRRCFPRSFAAAGRNGHMVL